MRVALIAPQIPDYSLEYAQAISGDCDVLLCIAEKFRDRAHFHFNRRVEIEWLCWPRQRQLLGYSFARKLSQRIRQWRPDVVHFMSESNLWFNVLAWMLKPIPIITTVHDIELHPGDSSASRIPRFFVKKLVRQSDAIVVHGEALRAGAYSKLPVRPDRVFVISHPPLTHYLELANANGFLKPTDGVFRVLFFGRIYEYKGLQYLLEAAPLVHAKVPHVQFLIAGTGDDILARHPRLRDIPYIRFDFRFIPTEVAARYFAEADLLVLPYIEASQSGVLMMALPFGLPVVATEVGEIASFVRASGMGLAVAPRKADDFADAITKIALDKQLWTLFSNNAKRAVAGDYSRNAISANALRMYQIIVDDHRRSVEDPDTYA